MLPVESDKEIPLILVVDDDTVIVRLLAAHLKPLGRLRFATNGEKALQLMREALPDLVLLDAQMPGLTGFEFLDEKRKDPRLAEVPVIMITHLADSHHEQTSLEKGATDFLSKPVNPAILKARVQTQLRLAQANKQLRQMSANDRNNLDVAMRDLQASNAWLKTTVDDLAATNERLSHFVRIASHDLREPLNTIDQFSGLLEEDEGPRLSHYGQHYLRLVRKAGARMRTLLDDVVNYAQLDVDLQEAMAPVSLQTLLADLKDAFAARMEATGATLDVGPLPDVVGHGSLLAMVFHNLLSNSLKFVRPGSAPRIRVSAIESESQVLIEFMDNGIGIRVEDQEKIFQPFVRLNRKHEFDGTGLGLTQARKIIEAHGGTLGVLARTEVASGTTLRIALPKQPRRQPP